MYRARQDASRRFETVAISRSKRESLSANKDKQKEDGVNKNLLCVFFDHKFGEWKYVASDSCERIRVCKRDGYEERRVGPHQFGEWKYVASDSCERIRVCKRDGYEERRVGPHQFGEWKYVTSSEQIRVCKRDGYEEKRHHHQHSWTIVEYTSEIYTEGGQEAWGVVEECSCGERRKGWV